jgi:hypothetical protein
LLAAAGDLRRALKALVAPLNEIACRALCAKTAASSGAAPLAREAAARRIERRAKLDLPGGFRALGAVGQTAPGGFVDWLGVALRRTTPISGSIAAIDPTMPFAAEV